MQNLKKDTNEVIYKTETDSQTQKTNYGCQRGKVGMENKLGVWDCHIHTSISKIDNQKGPTVQHRELCSVLCNDLNG